jgi:hypothetical protein
MSLISSDIACGATIPLSVIIASMYSAGVTSNMGALTTTLPASLDMRLGGAISSAPESMTCGTSSPVRVSRLNL